MKFPMLSSIFLILLSSSISDRGIGVASAAGRCLQDQKDLLLELRNNLSYDFSLSTKLVHWDESSDCCRWAGVRCDAKGHVSGLDLSSEAISGGISDTRSSLFRLLFLESLNLAENAFGSVEFQFPIGFGKLTELRYLNLSNSGFPGQIPLDISNLTRLVVLDLSSAYSSVSLENPNLERLIHKLNMLQELYLGGVNVSTKGPDWCHALSSHVRNLRVLSMPNSYLTGPFDSSLSNLQSLSVVRLDGNTFSTAFPGFFADFSQLKILTLSACDISGVVPGKLFQIKTLEIIDLSNNRDQEGSLTEFPSNGSLQTLQLQYTKFSGNLSESLGNLEMLLNLDLRSCSFSGTIPSSIRSLARLEHLDLSLNQFIGSVPSFASLKNLKWIDLRHNSLTGQIPDAVWKGLDNLEYLDLSENALEGEIPASVLALPSLESLDLSNNSFSGSITDTNTASSPLSSLKLSFNNLEGSLPKFLFDLRNLSDLSLSSNKFNGSVELTDFQKLSGLVVLDLSFNHLSVHINENVSLSVLFPKLQSLKLASCKLEKMPSLKNQSSLMMLDLSDNQIRGEIPNWLWEVSNGLLRFLNLSHNYFTHLQEPYDLRGVYLDSLLLHSNMLSGQIPTPPGSIYIFDLSKNNFSSIPANIGNSLQRAFFVSMANNRITGTIPPSLCNATELQVLDLSNNYLQGRIPSCLLDKSIGVLHFRMNTTLNVLNLRRNNLSGAIPDAFPVGCSLETLDLSWNFLQGEVPKSMARCTELQVLNLGDNKLDGPFPCWLKNLSKLQVLVLRSNKFHGTLSCLRDEIMWLNLQIIDIASNNLDGVLPGFMFPKLKALMANQEGARGLHHLHFVSAVSNEVYYQYSVTLTVKGLTVEHTKILNILTSVDFSGNHFQGRIPETIGELNSLYVLNLSGNALLGRIPASIGNLKGLESLDLSLNSLAGEIPNELASLTFLSFLNLSYNHLVGRIPLGGQTRTFLASSFEGNEGLCGFPLNSTCSELGTPEGTFPQPDQSEEDDEKRDVGLYVSVAMGFAVGAAFIFLPLVVFERWRKGYNRHADKFILFILRRQEQNEDW